MTCAATSVLAALCHFAYAQADCTTNGTGLCTYVKVGQSMDITTPFVAFDGLSCHKVTNNCSDPANDDLMVPYSSPDEWNSFLQSEIATSNSPNIRCVQISKCSQITVILTPNPAIVAAGLSSTQPSTLSWVIQNYSGSVTCTPGSNDGANGGNGSWPAAGEPVPIVNPNSSFAVTPLAPPGASVVYTLACTDSLGNKGSGTALVSVAGGSGGGSGCAAESNLQWAATNIPFPNQSNLPGGGSCSGSVAASSTGTIVPVANTDSAYTGQETATCGSNGSWYFSNQSCYINGCVVPGSDPGDNNDPKVNPQPYHEPQSYNWIWTGADLLRPNDPEVCNWSNIKGSSCELPCYEAAGPNYPPNPIPLVPAGTQCWTGYSCKDGNRPGFFYQYYQCTGSPPAWKLRFSACLPAS